jgi:hypothetical protein
VVAIYPAKRVKAQSRPDDRVRFPPTIYLQSQVKMPGGAMAMVAATTSLAAPTLIWTRKVGGHVLLSGNGRPCLTLAQRRRSESTIFSGDPPAKVERAPMPVDPPRSHSPSLIAFQKSPRALEPKVDCPRQLLLRHEPWIQRCHLIAATLANYPAISCRR